MDVLKLLYDIACLLLCYVNCKFCGFFCFRGLRTVLQIDVMTRDLVLLLLLLMVVQGFPNLLIHLVAAVFAVD